METYGIVQVRLLQEVVMATYTLRTFHVKNLKIKKVCLEKKTETAAFYKHFLSTEVVVQKLTKEIENTTTLAVKKILLMMVDCR